MNLRKQMHGLYTNPKLSKVHWISPHNFTFVTCSAKPNAKSGLCYTKKIDAVTCTKCIDQYNQLITAKKEAPYRDVINQIIASGLTVADIRKQLGI